MHCAIYSWQSLKGKGTMFSTSSSGRTSWRATLVFFSLLPPSRVSRMKKEKKYKASNVNWCKAQRSNLYSFICLVQWEIHSCSPPFNFFATKLKTQEFTDPKPLLGKSGSFNFKVANLGRNRIGNFKHFGSKDM